MTVGQFQSHLAELTTAAGGSAITVDWAANGFAQDVPLSAASCTLTFTAPKTDAILLLRLTQDGTGGRQVVLPGSVVGSFALGLTLNSSTVVTLFYTRGAYYVIASSTTGSNVYRNTYYVNSAFAGPGSGNGTAGAPFTSMAAVVAADPLGALIFLPPFSLTTENFVSPTGPTGWDIECQSLLGGPCTISGTLTLTSSAGSYALKDILVSGVVSGVATSARNELYIDSCFFTSALSLTASGSGSWLVALKGFGPPKSHQSGYFNGTISIAGSLYATDWEFTNSVSITGGALSGCQFDSGATSITIAAALLIQNTTFAAAPTFTGAGVVTMDGFSHASARAVGGPILAGGATLVILNDVDPSGITPGSNTQVLTTVAGVTAWATPVAGLALATTAPADVTKAAAAVGTGSTAARVDHKHDVLTAAASGAVVIGSSGAEGTATSLARSDHAHPVAAAGVPVDVGTANSAGSATTFASSNHVHNTPFSAVVAALGAASTSIGVNAQRITSVADPTSSQDAATKAYVDALAQGLSVKPSVIALENAANVASLSGLTTTAGGVLLNTDGMRVALGAQTTGSQTGIYAVHAGAWTRVTDYATGSHAAGTFFFVEEGTNANGGFVCSSVPGSDLVGTNTLVFTQFSGAGEITAGVGLVKSGNTLSIGFAGGAPANVTKATAAAGTSSEGARIDHKHDVSTASAASVGAANAEGTSTSLARSDHEHAVVDLAIAGQTQGDTIFYNGSNWVRLAPATTGLFLKTLGAAANPAWAVPLASQISNDASTAPGSRVSNALDDLLLEYPRGTYAITTDITLDFTTLGKLGVVTTSSGADINVPLGGPVGAKFDLLLLASASDISISEAAGVTVHNLAFAFRTTQFIKVSLSCIGTNEWVVTWVPLNSSDLPDTSAVGGDTVAASLNLLHASTAASLSGSGMVIPLIPFLNTGFSGGLTDDFRGTNAGGDMGVSVPLYPNVALREITLTIEPNIGHGGVLPSGMPFFQVWTSSTFAHATAGLVASVVDTSANTTIYEASHSLQITFGTPLTAINAMNTWLRINDESGGVSGLRLKNLVGIYF